MKEHTASNMLWDGLRTVVKDILFLEIGCIIYCCLMASGEMLP